MMVVVEEEEEEEVVLEGDDVVVVVVKDLVCRGTSRVHGNADGKASQLHNIIKVLMLSCACDFDVVELNLYCCRQFVGVVDGGGGG
jgi:hypothetical protein